MLVRDHLPESRKFTVLVIKDLPEGNEWPRSMTSTRGTINLLLLVLVLVLVFCFFALFAWERESVKSARATERKENTYKNDIHIHMQKKNQYGNERNIPTHARAQRHKREAVFLDCFACFAGVKWYRRSQNKTEQKRTLLCLRVLVWRSTLCDICMMSESWFVVPRDR